MTNRILMSKYSIADMTNDSCTISYHLSLCILKSILILTSLYFPGEFENSYANATAYTETYFKLHLYPRQI